MNICEEIGCDFEQSEGYGLELEAYILDCVDCGRRVVLNVKEGAYDQKKYGELTKRSYIQPSQAREWAKLQEHKYIKDGNHVDPCTA